MRRRQRDAAPLKAAETGCAPAPARPRRPRDTTEGPPRLPGDQVLLQTGGKSAHPPGLAPPKGRERGTRGGGEHLSCLLHAGPWASSACPGPRAALRGAPPEPGSSSAHRRHPTPLSEPLGSGMQLQGARAAPAHPLPHAIEKVFTGPFGKKEDEPRAKLKITSHAIERDTLRLQTLHRLLPLEPKASQCSCCGTRAEAQRESRAVRAFSDLFFHARVKEQFRYEFCLRGPNADSLLPPRRTIPRNKSFFNSETRRPTCPTALYLDRE